MGWLLQAPRLAATKGERLLLMNDDDGKAALLSTVRAEDRAAVGFTTGKGASFIVAIDENKVESVAVEGQGPIRLLGTRQETFLAASDTGLIVLGPTTRPQS